MAAVWRLPPAEHEDTARPLPRALAVRLHGTAARLHDLLGHRPAVCLLPHPCGASGRAEDRCNHSVRSFRALKMPFGLLNASQTFQRFIYTVLRDVPATFAYIDDILVASKTADEHQQHLRLVFQRLQDHGLIVNRQKSVLGEPQLIFPGYDGSAADISPPAARVAAICDFKQPTTDQEVFRFVGMASFYHRFIPNAATLLQPLAALSQRKLGRKPSPVAWTENADAAFRAVKAALSEAVRLTHPVPGAPLSLQVDASDTGTHWCGPPAIRCRLLAAAGILLPPVQARSDTVQHVWPRAARRVSGSAPLPARAGGS